MRIFSQILCYCDTKEKYLLIFYHNINDQYRNSEVNRNALWKAVVLHIGYKIELILH